MIKKIILWVFLIVLANVAVYVGKYVSKKMLTTAEILAYANVREEIKASKFREVEKPNIPMSDFKKLGLITGRNTRKVFWFSNTNDPYCGRIEEDGKNQITVICNETDCARFTIREKNNRYYLYSYSFFERDPVAECYPFIIS